MSGYGGRRVEWKNGMAYRVYGDRIVVVQGPVGYKRTWWFSEAKARPGAEG